MASKSPLLKLAMKSLAFERHLRHLVRGALSLSALAFGLAACSQGNGEPEANLERETQAVTTLNWKGHNWNVTSGGMAGVASGSPSNVWVDANGYLHLRIAKNGSTWTAAELFTTDNIGFGTYQWQIDGPIDRIDKNVVLGLFPYGPAAGIGGDGTNEIDIEYARWGYANGSNGSWTDYPASGSTIGTFSYTFSLNGGTSSTSRFVWTSTSIDNALLNGYVPVGSNAGLTKSWLYKPSNPSVNIPQKALPLGMNLWCFGAPPSDGKNVEIVIRDFQYVPLGSSTTQYTISASAGANGSISPAGTVSVNQGSTQSFSITPNAGYTVGSVTVDNVNQGAISSYSFSNVQASHTIGASFVASTGQTSNIAPSGIAYVWYGLSTATSNANRRTAAGLNDGNLTGGVNLNPNGEGGAALWEGAGVLWSSAKSLSSINFINGAIDGYGNGYLQQNCKLQFTTDGTTWTDSGWTLSPAYPYTSSAGGQTYTFSGTAVSGKVGARVVGQTGSMSWSWIVSELRTFGQ
jgi:hypothetical protein